ncbi:hypothetical protein MOQ_006214 [Trypanosoma cruzi marinkellei]|uniref:Endonuclease/exonuclease/phosphatase domain-containing protein n=1 Tax=Trypanosoma cruzi marinkellei TaxID=85056 RepID=K2M4Y2_TRYCR|nr:hypothetical protein MOQ_006214 [Trypanosoma cruzi marinkellei]
MSRGHAIHRRRKPVAFSSTTEKGVIHLPFFVDEASSIIPAAFNNRASTTGILRELSRAPAMRSAPCHGAGALVVHRKFDAAHSMSTTETKTTSPQENVTCHARCEEVKRSACRLSDKTARPFRCGHSVDITRCGDAQKNPGAEEDGYITIWQLNIAGFSSVKKIAFAARLEQHPPDIVLLQEINNRSDVATKLSGYNEYLQARTGRGGGVAILVRHSLPC